MLLSIVLAVVVALFIATASHIVNGGRIVETITPRDPSEGSYLRFSLFNKVRVQEWLVAILIGFLVGLINFVVPRLTVRLLFLAPICLVAMLGLYVFLMYWWRTDGSDLKELIPFVILAVLFYFTTKAAAMMTTALWDNAFWTSVVNIIPILTLIASIGFFIIDALYFRYREVYADDEKASIFHILGIVAIVLTTLLLLYFLIFGIKWANFKWPNRSIDERGTETEVSAETESETSSAKEDDSEMTEEEKKQADDAVRKLIPAEVDKTEVDAFYVKEFKDGILMANTLPTLAEDRKDNTAALRNGEGLYGAVEFPVDIVLSNNSSHYTSDHEGAYTKEELEKINSWILDRLKDGKLTDDEKHLIIDWVSQRIARDPVYGNMWAQAFAELHSRSGKSCRELFPWLDEFLTKWEKGERLEHWTCKYEGDNKTYVHPDYKPIGYRLVLTFVRLTVVDISKPDAWHWYMEEMTDLPSKNTTVKAPYMESEAAAVFAAHDKGREVFKERLALNLYDGRAEIIPIPEEPEKPEESEPESSEPESSEPESSEPEESEPESSEPEESEPESSEPEESEPESSEPEESEPESSEPEESEPESSEPEESEPEESEPEESEYDKDPDDAPKDNTEENDDSGPGPNTNNGEGSKESTEDESSNSNHMTQEEYEEEMSQLEEYNEEQKEGGDSNDPSVTKPPATSEDSKSESSTEEDKEPPKIDNNADSGTSEADPIDIPTESQPLAETTDGEEIDSKPGEAWGGPPD